MNGTKEITLKLETVTEQEDSSTVPIFAAHTSLPSQYCEISNLLEIETETEQEESSTVPIFAAHTSLPSQYCEICNLLVR